MAVHRSFFLFVVAVILSAKSAFGERLNVVVISDLNGRYGSTSYARRVTTAIDRIIALEPDLVISTGDMVAGQHTPHLSTVKLQNMWDAFHATVSDPLGAADIPLVVTPGNHDGSAYSGFEKERELYRKEWKSRKPDLHFVDDEDYPFYYSFDFGEVRFISLDATTLGPLRGDQMERLTKDAAGAQNVATFSHLPLWPFSQKRENEIIGDPALEGRYMKHGVNLHLSGHHHAYYPGEKNGIAYISQACLGGGTRKLIGDSKTSQHSFTVLKFEDGRLISTKAYAAPDYTGVIDHNTLPKTIRSKVATLTRMETGD